MVSLHFVNQYPSFLWNLLMVPPITDGLEMFVELEKNNFLSVNVSQLSYTNSLSNLLL